MQATCKGIYLTMAFIINELRGEYPISLRNSHTVIRVLKCQRNDKSQCWLFHRHCFSQHYLGNDRTKRKGRDMTQSYCKNPDTSRQF